MRGKPRWLLCRLVRRILRNSCYLLRWDLALQAADRREESKKIRGALEDEREARGKLEGALEDEREARGKLEGALERHQAEGFTHPVVDERRGAQSAFRQFLLAEREHMVLCATRFWYANRPATDPKDFAAYYFEFGCYSAQTMRYAWTHSGELFNWQYVAFDSFEGLPDMSEADACPTWQRGSFSMSEEVFLDVLHKSGMPAERIRTVKGFYSDSLTQKLKNELLPSRAAVVYIDCDLYESTVPVLRFCKDFLQKGTIIIFDDWNNLFGDPDRGERKAWREFLEDYPNLRFQELTATSIQKAFVFMGKQ